MEISINKRDYFFDTLKGFLIIAVIVGNTLELASPTNVNVHYFILFLYMFHMPVFTFVSGYFSKRSKRTTVQKVKHIFTIYVLAQILYVAYYNYILHGELDFTLLATQWTFWYLLSLTAWYIISDYIKNEKLWLIGSIIFSLIIGFDTSVGSNGSFSRTFFFLPFFIAGMMFKREYIETIKKYRNYLLIGSIIILIILYFLQNYIPVDLLFEYTNYEHFIDLGLFPLFCRAFHYIGAFLIGGFLISIIPQKITSLSSLGKMSLYMYLFHGTVANTMLPYLNFNTLFSCILSCVTVVLICIIISIGMQHLSKTIKEKNKELSESK